MKNGHGDQIEKTFKLYNSSNKSVKTPVMPRRRGPTNSSSSSSAGRRTTNTANNEDGRCNGKKSTTAAASRNTTTTTKKESGPASVSPPTVQSVNEAPPEAASQSSDLGYLHKKFKKVAATFSTTPEPTATAAAAAIPAEEETTTTTTVASDESTKKEDGGGDSNGSLKSKSGGRYVCPYCQHACAKPSVLEKHIRAHTNERPYPCVPCGFAFKTKSNLYKHCKSRTHVLKLEESGGAAPGTGSNIDPSVEGGSDDTSDDNAMLDDSDDGEPLVVLPSLDNMAPTSSASSTPEKFKTPYKPKFHNLKNPDEEQQPMTTAAATDGVSNNNSAESSNRQAPSAGFLHERITQIISKNQAIVETLDPIWPRRYVRQSSKETSTTTTTTTSAKSPRPEVLPSPKKVGLTGRERSCSLSLISNDSSSAETLLLPAPAPVAPSTLRILQEASDENQRKRCYSEGPAVTDNQLRHSVRNLLHQPPKPPRTDVVNPQNPEGSIIKDILLKSRGLLPTDGKDVPVDPPTKMSSSFTVSALLNPSTTRAKPVDFTNHPHIGPISLELTVDDDPERPSKRPKVSPSEVASAFSRPLDQQQQQQQELNRPTFGVRDERMRTSLPLFGGEVEIHDGPQRTVMRIDPAGYSDSNRTSNGLTEMPAVIVTKASLSSGGGIVRIQPQESRISVFPVIKTAGFETKSGDARSVIIHQPPPSVPYIPGIPGPYSSSGWLPVSTVTSAITYSTPTTAMVSSSSSSSSSSIININNSTRPLPSITVHPPQPAAAVAAGPEERTDSGFDDDDPSTPAAKFLRPNSLSLQPGTFNLKKTNMAGLDHSGQPNMLCVSGAGMTLISPETPRPRKLFRQLYLNGHAYTYLGLKCSTRVYFCCLSRAQPMYVPHHPKLSMYSQWKTRAPASAPPGLEASSPVQTMALYDSRQRPSTTTTAQSADHGRMILTHSSYWTNRDRPTTTHLKLEVTEGEAVPVQINENNPPAVEIRVDKEEAVRPEVTSSPATVAAQPKRVRIFAGGYKSTEEYTYVRGRGRGRYVCEECGIRCKKPSMLKKHIRTHTDLRPYTCRQCNFSFKTKGNLTKHMKSKAHHKKCTELGIVPVPTTVDEANIDEDSLARQETLKKMKLAGGSGNEGDSDLDDEDDDDDDDEEDEEVEGEEEEEETEEDPPTLPVKSTATGQFEDATEPVRGEREQEVARSLLDLGVMAPAGCKPTTYPYASHFHPAEEETPPSIEIPEMKEEPQAPSPVSKPQQPMDLSTSNANVTASGILASIYSPIVSETAARRGLSPESSVQPATSGMLQAYLTEKALKEGLMKRHQVKMTTPSAVVEHPVVTFFPAQPRAAEKSRSEFVVPLSSSTSSAIPTSSAAYKLTDDGKTACSICNKVFTKPSQLRLHINIHYFERPFRCEACAVSFRTKGHLQKHKRSVTHFNKVNMNLTFGTPSTENPRPFKCSDCMIAFRIHGHLAKHLRSKMHIMKLECLGKLPFGTYAEMERSGINLNEIDTTDCHNSLESLQSLAHRLYKQDPSKIQQWQQEAQAAEASLRERTISGSSEEFSDVADEGDEMDEDGEDSDGLPDGAVVDEAPPQRKATPPESISHRPDPPRAASPPMETRRLQPPPAMYCSACGESCASMEAFQLHVMEKHRPPSPPPPRTPVKSPPPPTVESPAKLAPPNTPDVGRVVNLAVESRRSPSRVMESTKSSAAGPPTSWNRGPGDLQYAQPRSFYHPATVPSALPPPPPLSAPNMWPPRQPTFGDLMSLSAIPPQWHQDPAAMAWIASRHMMLPLAGHPHNYPAPHGHAHTANGALQQQQPRLYSPTTSSSANPVSNEDVVFPCELCGKSFTAKETLRQHMLAHAQPRPFVCEFCDAGFTTQKQLESHLVLHRPRTS